MVAFSLGYKLEIAQFVKSLYDFLSSGFSGSYFIQKFAHSRYPVYPIKFSILVSALVGCGASYKVTSEQMFACQAKWMAAEDKYFPSLK
jgi:TMEM141 protein family